MQNHQSNQTNQPRFIHKFNNGAHKVFDRWNYTDVCTFGLFSEVEAYLERANKTKAR